MLSAARVSLTSVVSLHPSAAVFGLSNGARLLIFLTSGHLVDSFLRLVLRTGCSRASLFF